ncbi:MAG: hypothetical protein P1U61_02440 [Legionellaceae bacterium]|nr:hypothetical protein [Legionellaceae bacterium]
MPASKNLLIPMSKVARSFLRIVSELPTQKQNKFMKSAYPLLKETVFTTIKEKNQEAASLLAQDKPKFTQSFKRLDEARLLTYDFLEIDGSSALSTHEKKILADTLAQYAKAGSNINPCNLEPCAEATKIAHGLAPESKAVKEMALEFSYIPPDIDSPGLS